MSDFLKIEKIKVGFKPGFLLYKITESESESESESVFFPFFTFYCSDIKVNKFFALV